MTSAGHEDRRSWPALGWALVLFGLLLLGSARVVGGTEEHAYAPGATPPRSVQVTEGKTYQLSVPGGIGALRAHGLAQATLRCTIGGAGISGTDAPVPLVLTPQSDGSRATNTVATFTAPLTGQVHVDCADWGAMFVDDADDAPTDVAGGLLLAGIVALTLGAALAMAAAYWRGCSARPAVHQIADDTVGTAS